jgi:hypothetical protein
MMKNNCLVSDRIGSMIDWFFFKKDRDRIDPLKKLRIVPGLLLNYGKNFKFFRGKILLKKVKIQHF